MRFDTGSGFAVISAPFVKKFLPLVGLFLGVAVAAAQQNYEPYRVTTLLPTANGDPIGSHATIRAVDVAMGPGGNLFVLEHSAVRKIAPNGAVSTVVTDVGFVFASGLAVTPAGKIYVCDTYNHNIREIMGDGSVRILAGGPGGTENRGSQDGIGSAARFNFPIGITIGSDGNLYVADRDNDTIRKITPQGAVTTVAGLAGSDASVAVDGHGSGARFVSPSGITSDDAGNLYVTDWSCVRKITPAGNVTTMAGVSGGWGNVDGQGDNARFNTLAGITHSGADLFVVDAGNGLIRKISLEGNVSTLAGGYPMQYQADLVTFDGKGNQARFYNPHGITADSTGTLYVAEEKIRKVTPEGVVTTLAPGTLFGFGVARDDLGGVPPFSHLSDLALDPAGNLYVVDFFHACLRKIDPGGVVSTVRTTFLRPDGRRIPMDISPRSIAIDSAGNIFFSQSSYINKISPQGDVTVFAGHPISSGSADGIGTNARFQLIAHIAFDRHDNLYVADQYNFTIRKITPGAVVTTVAGSPFHPGTNDGVGSAARFALPVGVAPDSAGNVFVADASDAVFGNTIRKVSPDGQVTTIAGSPGEGGYADGVGKGARFWRPTAVTVDRKGNVFVTDSTNTRLRKVTSAGVVTTLAGSDGSTPGVDGIGSSATFDYGINAIVRDGVGNLYVADGNRLRIAASTSVAHPLNVSTRLQVLEDENVLIGGFIVGGTTRKTVVVRALGPSLGANSIEGALEDPRLELYDSTGLLVAQNDNWKIDAKTLGSQQALIEATTIAPSDERESALVATIYPQQGYTGVVRGKNGLKGVAVVEVYDLTSSTAASLANISTRGFVESGDAVMIGGFILGGSDGGSEVLVRALGPSLAQFGITNHLANPTLELFNANGQAIVSNDDWTDANGPAIQATGLQPTNNLESAILTMLPTGAYTAVVSGRGGSGVGLVEVYNLP